LAVGERDNDRVRLFVAVALPDAVADLVAALPRPDRSGLRWTSPAQWHVTLRFLGEAPPGEVIPAVEQALETIDSREPAVAQLGPATEWFPGRRVLRVPVAGLDRLAAAVRPTTQAWGPENEPPFAGHLTLARTAGRRRGPPELAGVRLSADFPVTEIGVYSSRPGRQGSVYERLSAHPLGRPDAPTDSQ
jgi:2'-5' RNA ligase